ncbi:VanZ family protein [Streptomyces graminilatus]|uniref:VanZ family protein n=1 Tax=Streptomyces graminilatus TaxID=1464070 RepID=UPI0006E2A1A8|nr:VanZ family protein [Streptomyces graminilatus]
MFTAIFKDHYGFLAVLSALALVAGLAAWRIAIRLHNPHGIWWLALVGTLTGVLGVTSFGGAGEASGRCVINHQLAEPFHTTQGIWNLAMFLPIGFFALLALRRPLPVFIGVVAMPCVIELTQALVPGISRNCDSADAEMNIIGGTLGFLTAGILLATRRGLQWRGSAKPSIITALTLLVAGLAAFQTSITPLNYEGTSLSDTTSTQEQAVREAVEQAFGDHYSIGRVHLQPCTGVRCANLTFNIADEGYASLEWPSRRHLNILLEPSDTPGPGSFPVSGATTPHNADDAARIADRYMRDHYPWAIHATIRNTYAVGENASFGWMTSWRFRQKNVLMPRMLDVEINRAGRVSQIDVIQGPIRLSNLPAAKLSGKQAEQAAIRQANKMASDNGRELRGLSAHATTLKANKRENGWRPEWLVSTGITSEGDAGFTPADTAWVDAISGTVYDSAYPPQ